MVIFISLPTIGKREVTLLGREHFTNMEKNNGDG